MTDEEILERIESARNSGELRGMVGSFLCMVAAIFAVGAFNWGVKHGFPNSMLMAASVARPDNALLNVNDGLPPKALRGNRRVSVSFESEGDVSAKCGTSAIACAGVGGITITNPCAMFPNGLPPFRDSWNTMPARYWGIMKMQEWYDANVTPLESYRSYVSNLCHELGHANGWSGDHWMEASEVEEATGYPPSSYEESSKRYRAQSGLGVNP